MNLNKEILDDQNSFDNRTRASESRLVKGVRITLGILLTVIGSIFLLGMLYDLYRIIQFQSSQMNTMFPNYFSWGDWLLNKSLSFIYTLCFLIGGIGLLRSTKTGWMVSLSTAFFAVLNIGFLVFWVSITQTGGSGDFGFFGWVLFGIALFFSLVTFLLLYKPVRVQFNPTPKTFILGGIVLGVFCLDLTCILTILG